jgi:hypothetical protein
VKRLQIRVQEDLDAALSAQAERVGVSKSALIRRSALRAPSDDQGRRPERFAADRRGRARVRSMICVDTSFWGEFATPSYLELRV